MSTWHEIVVVGSERSLRGFVAGFVGGRALAEVVLLARDVGAEPESLAGRLRDLVSSGAHHLVLAPAAVAAELAAAIARTGGDVELRVDRHREVTAASFSFAAEAFSPEIAARIEEALHQALPPAVAIEAFDEQERDDGGARGAELYAPTHHYTYRARGRVAGELTGVIEMHRRAELLEFVKAEPIVVETRALPAR